VASSWFLFFSHHLYGCYTCVTDHTSPDAPQTSLLLNDTEAVKPAETFPLSRAARNSLIWSHCANCQGIKLEAWVACLLPYCQENARQTDLTQC